MWTAFSWIVLTTSARLIVVLASPSSDVHSILHRYQRQSSCKPKLDFSCSNGECIPSYNLCDGSKDCSDGSDETTTVCRAIPIRCSTLSFECAYGACIDRDLKCDGKSDCADGSDEQDCGPPPSSSNCGSQMFRCSDGQCIDQYSICDGLKDCSDGSDETATLCRPLKCPSSSFQCAYGACMEQGVKCNGQQDCPDGSDEWGCSTPSPPTYVTSSPVPSGGCILPQHPQHGVYSSSLCQIGDARAACRNSPGTAVPNNWLLKYSCNANYDLTSSDSEFSVCDNGQWKNPLDCIKLCSPLQSLSVDVRCALNGREVSCDRPMKPNTTATARCRQHYQEAYKPQYASLLCRDNGEWNYRLFYCVPGTPPTPKINIFLILITPEQLKKYLSEIPTNISGLEKDLLNNSYND